MVEFPWPFSRLLRVETKAKCRRRVETKVKARSRSRGKAKVEAQKVKKSKTVEAIVWLINYRFGEGAFPPTGR